jgi:antitoxin MazE
MIKTLTPIGNSLGIIIDRPILELLRIDRETPLEITTDGKGFYVRPVPFADEAEVLKSVERMLEVHSETFRRLAE